MREAETWLLLHGLPGLGAGLIGWHLRGWLERRRETRGGAEDE